MRETMKNLIKNTITSIGIALTVFCITGMVFDIAIAGIFQCSATLQYDGSVGHLCWITCTPVRC